MSINADGIHPDLGLQCGSGGGIKSETGSFKMVNSLITQNEAAIANNRRNDCYLVNDQPNKGEGIIPTSRIADQSCPATYHGDQPIPLEIGASELQE